MKNKNESPMEYSEPDSHEMVDAMELNPANRRWFKVIRVRWEMMIAIILRSRCLHIIILFIHITENFSDAPKWICDFTSFENVTVLYTLRVRGCALSSDGYDSITLASLSNHRAQPKITACLCCCIGRLSFQRHNQFEVGSIS